MKEYRVLVCLVVVLQRRTHLVAAVPRWTLLVADLQRQVHLAAVVQRRAHLVADPVKLMVWDLLPFI